jgi:hypothetical protein
VNRRETTPTVCQLCNETFPDSSSAWHHRCPEWDRVVRTNRPTLASHRNIIKFYSSMPEGIFKRMVRLGLRMSLGVDATLLDALATMPMRYSFRTSRRLVKRGLVRDVRDDPNDVEKQRRLFQREFPNEEPF